jgi:Ca-activated chloride channel family protein
MLFRKAKVRTGPRFHVTFSKLLLLASSITWMCSAANAQSSLDDVHIQPGPGHPMPTLAATGLGALDSGSKPMKVNVDLVLVPVTILDGMNRLIRGLGKNDFQLFEGKRQQQIRYFSNEDAPVSLGIILDISGSMKDKAERAHEAVMDFLKSANPQDEFFLITFSDKPEQLADFTQRPEDIQSKLVYAYPKGRTALLDAIYMGISKMRHARYERKALLIISDGGDNHSRYTQREVVSLVKEADVMIYGVGIYSTYFSSQEEFLGPELLKQVSEVTGGTTFTIGDPRDLSDVAKAVGMMLRNQYLLGYRPEVAKKDGKWHKIKIIFKRRKIPNLSDSFRVFARAGYYAPAE